MDIDHYEIHGEVSDVNVINDGKNAQVEIDTGDETEELVMRKFAFSQLLKFADLRKKSLKGKEGEILPDAGNTILEALEDQDLVFKVGHDHEEVVGTVSPKYASIASAELENLVRETITSMGIDEFEHSIDREGVVTEQVFEFTNEDAELEEVGDTLNGGLFIRNSVFGASSLRINRYYTVLACSNGMISRRSQSSFRKVHMGETDKLREQIKEEVEAQIEHIWEDTELIEHIATIEFPIEDQIDFLEALAENQKITKKAASAMAGKILNEAGVDPEEEELEIEAFDLPDEISDQEWNTGQENVWGLVNAFTGYAEHSDISSESSLQQIQRSYNQILEVEDEDELRAIVE